MWLRMGDSCSFQGEQPLTITNLNVIQNWFEELNRLVPTDN